ncbi:MAG: 4'-phosphopantetheinyl transferase superfamily protein [Proteobacteria bacterium]|nr:4'-phosphopantetheinyl transferase superfamily protein [Pseudomonadota bacterium]
MLAIATQLPHAGSPEQARQHARALARAALRRALADAWGCAPQALTISDQRGQPPRLGWAGTGAAPAALAGTGLSISHAPGMSLVACYEQGSVGVDLQAMPLQASRADLLRTASLFLPQNSVETLAKQTPGASFMEAFTDRWAAHEAALKCLGQALVEYHPALAARLAGVRTARLALPGWAAADLVAALAWRPAQP